MEIKLCAFSDEAGYSIEEQVAALKENDVYLTELRSAKGVSIKDFDDDTARQYASYLSQNGIKVFALGSPLGKTQITEDFENSLKVLDRLIELCRIFDTDKIRMFSFFTKNPESVRDEVIDRLNKLVKTAQKANILLCHENEKDIFGDKADRVIDLTKNVSGLKFVFDPANYIQCKQDIAEAADSLVENSEYLHIKDAIYSTGAVVPAGEGDGQIERIIGMLKKDTVLTIEPHLKVFSGYAAIDSAKLKNKYEYSSNREAFKAATDSLKKILINLGYKEIDKSWKK